MFREDATAPLRDASAPPGDPGRWYTHGWNRDISWRLIFGILPRIPAFLRPPIHLLTTLICFAAMPAERRAVRRNLERVAGRGGPSSLLASFRLFYNFSKFMAAFVELCPFRPEAFEGRLLGSEETTRAIHAGLASGRGLVLLSLHQGHYEVGLALLSRLGIPVTVVIMPEDSPGARFEQQARSQPNVRVLSLRDSNLAGLELMLALRRNEIVAMQADRSPGSAVRPVPLFGRDVELPVGPLLLASAAGAPILLVVTLIRDQGRFELVSDGPFDPPPSDGRSPPREEDLDRAHRDLAARMEEMIRLCPEQWFNFYDVWAPGDSRGEGRR